MAVGRITGPLLSKNLLRDGVDLSFETNLLYLDVTNGRIGIKTANPQYTLDVQGNTNVLALRVETTSTLGNLTISSTSASTILNNSLGDLQLQTQVDKKILLKNDTLVSGNLHATGNITADGSVQLGNQTGTDTLSIYADIVSNITPQTPGQYDLGAPGKEWAQGYIDTLVAGALVGKQGGDVNITPALGKTTNINSNVRIWGDNPLGTGPITSNVLYVSMDGSDTNDGRAADATRACRTITGALRSPFYKEGTSIKVAPGRYFENNPLRMKRLTSIIGSDLRTTFIEPINKTQDLFWVNSGCYLAQMQFSNGQSGLLPGSGYTAGTNRGAYATAFPPNYGGAKIDQFYSPYIQNCTNQSGPWLQDGTMFVPNSTVQIPSGVGVATWVANTTTMLVAIEEGEVKVGDTINIGPTKPGYVNARTLLLANKAFLQEQVVAYIDEKYEYYGYDQAKCERDTSLIVDSLIADLVFPANGYTQSNFAGLQYWNQDGYTGLINTEVTTTTNAINYVSSIAQQVVRNVTGSVSSGTRYQSTITQTTGTAATSIEALAIATDFGVITNILTTGTSGVTDIIVSNSTDVVSTASQRAFNLLQSNKAYLQAEAIAYINSSNPGFVYDRVKCYRDVGYMIDSVSFDILYGGNRQAIQSGVYYYNFSNSASAIPKEIPQTTAAYHRIREIADNLLTNTTISKSPGNLSNQNVSLPAATTAEAATLKSMVDLITEIIGAGPDAALTPAPISLTKSTNANVLKAAEILKANKSFIVSEIIGFVEYTYNNGFAYNQPKCYRDTGLIIDSIATDLIYNGDTQSTFAGLQYWNQSGYTGLIDTELTATISAINYVSSIAQQVITNGTGTRYQSTLTQTVGFIYDHVKCARDTGLIVDALAQDLLFGGTTQSTFAGVQYWNHGSYVGSIAGELTTTTAAISYVSALAQKVILNDITGPRYQNTSTQTTSLPGATVNEQSILDTEFNIILNILSTGTAGVTDIINPNGINASTTASINNAFNLLQANKAYIQTETIAFVEDYKASTYPGFTYDKAKCYRDVGYMIDSVSFDLLFGGNLQAIESGVYYYGYNPSSTAVPDEQTQSAGAYAYLSLILPNIIRGIPLTAPYQRQVPQVLTGGNGTAAQVTVAQADINIIKNIILNGPATANAPAPIGLVKTDSAEIISAALKLKNNREFIKAEVVAYVNRTYGTGSNADVEKVAAEFKIITDILANGTDGVTDIIVPNGLPTATTTTIDAYNLLQTNKAYIQAETVAFVNSQNKIFDQTKCARDTRLIIDAIAQDVLFSTSSQSTFAGLQYWNQDGYTGLIDTEITTTTNAINWVKDIALKVIVNDTSGVRHGGGAQITYLPPASNAEQNTIGIDFDVITNILTFGTAGVTDIIVPNSLVASTVPNVQHAFDLLQANRSYLQQEAVGFVEATKSLGYVYDPVTCARDVGFIIDSICFDLIYGGNRQAVQSGVYYYGFSGGSSAIPGESENTLAAYAKLKELVPYIVQGISYPTPLQTSIAQSVAGTHGTATEASSAQDKVNIITSIIQSGPSVASAKRPIGLTPSTSTNVVSAARLLETNKEFLVAEVLTYISNPTGFVYDSAKCYRDVGYMIDSICFDLKNGGNRQAIQSGVYYYNFNSESTAIPNEIPQTTAAYNHIRNIVGKIITNKAITPSVGNTSTQVLLASTATSAEITSIYSKIDNITRIINSGPSVAPTKQPIGLTRSADANKLIAYDLLLANRSFIQSEVVAFTNLFDTGFVYNRAKCARDVGIVIENIAYDIAFGGNEKSREAGLAYWNGVTSYIPNEITETSDAFLYLATLAKDVVANTTTTNLLNDFQKSPQVINTVLTNGAIAQGIIDKLIAIINTIIVNGPTTAPTRQPGSGPDWGSVSAQVLLQTNRSFIQNEVVNWINTVYPNLSYAEDKCYRDTGLIIDAITQDIIINANAKSIEAGVTYWTGNRSVLENATFGDKNQVVETVAAINHAKAISLQIINNATVTSSAFVFNSPVKCSRDTGLIVDALAQDLLFGGNSQTTFAGIQYWNHGTYVGDITSQLTTTTAALNYISNLAQKIVKNITTGTRYQSTITQNIVLPAATENEAIIVMKNFSTVTDILSNGVVGVTDAIIPNRLTASADLNVVKAFNLLQANKAYLQAEAIGFVDATKNFRYDEVKCARDSGLIIDSIVMDLLYPTEFLSQSTFAGLQYWNQNGYTGNILNERDITINAINYASQLAQRVIVNDVGGPRYQTEVIQNSSLPAATSAEVTKINSEFRIITNILTTGTSGVTDLVVPNGISASSTTSTGHAYDLLQANRAYIQAEVVAFVEITKNFGFVYDQALCYRDVGYMLDSVSFDLLHGGNRQAVQSGVYYYSFNANSTAIPNERKQTVAAFQYIKTLTEKIAQNIDVVPLQTNVTQNTGGFTASPSIVPSIYAPAEKIIRIIENGPGEVRVKQPISLTKSENGDNVYAATNIANNRAFIIAETIAYINRYFDFSYDPVTCARDVGYIVDSVSFDLLYGGNRQSIQSGVYYWGYSDQSTSLPKERVASTLAYQYMKTLIGNVITATTPNTLYQNTVTQVTGLPAATAIEVATIGSNIDKITTIINRGPSAAGPKTPIGLVEDNNQFVRNAVNLLAANRPFIKAEIVAYVESTQVNNRQIFLPFYDMGANATLSVIRNFDIITNIIQNGVGVAPIRSDGNGIFVRTGMSNNDVKIAPVVTSVTEIGANQYQIEISESTIGYGDIQPLYFGQTAVFPLLDPAVPARWQQRRINPIGSMGGALIDGGVISDRSPINSFVFDAYTQLNQGGNGVFITNNGYAQLVSVFTIFCSNAVTVENGGIASITNSNSNFGDICLTAKGYGKRDFSGYIKNAPVLPYYPNGLYPQGGQIQVYIADPELRPHISLVMEVEPPAGFINNQGLPGFLSGQTTIGVLTAGTIEIKGIDNTGMVIGQRFYVIDQFGKQVDNNNQPYVKEGTIVANVGYQSVLLNYPLNAGGGDPTNNGFFNLYTCGKAYYTVLSSTVGADPIVPGTLLLPNEQNIEEAVSLDFINSLSQRIVTNSPVTPISSGTQVFDYTQVGGSSANTFIKNRLDIISNILVNGPTSKPTVTQTGTLPTGSGAAASLLNQNKSFIQDEVVAYVDQTFFNFSYNQVKCARDTGLIVDAIAQDLLFNTPSQTTFAGLQYWNQAGYTGGIFNELSTTTAAINYVKQLAQQVVQGQSGTRYTTGTQITNLTLATPAEAGIIGANFDIITNILTTGTAGVTDIIIPNSLTSSTNINVVRAYNLLQANKAYIQQEAVAFVESTKPGFRYNQSKCRRDSGLIVEAIALDLAFPTANNSQSTFAGLQYWGQAGYTGTIASELTTTTNAINYVSDLAQKVIVNDASGTRYSGASQVFNLSAPGSASEVSKINKEFSLITKILTTGTAGVTDLVVSNGITSSTSVTIQHAYTLLQANKTYLVEEAIAYINNLNPGFTYDETKCRRDVGYMIDSVSFDLLYGGNRQAIQSGVYYYNFNGTSAIPNEVTTTTNAFNYIKSIAQSIILNNAVTPRQTRISQVRSASSGTSAQSTYISAEIDLINNIITNGPSVVATKEPISLVKSTNANAINAATLLIANKDFIAAETLAYINQTYSFDYDQVLCERDVGYMVDGVSIDLLYGGNRQAVQSGVYYYSFNASSTAVPDEITQTVEAYAHIATLTQKIVLGQAVTALQSNVPQVISVSTGTTAEINAVQDLISNITNIVANGPNATLVRTSLPVTVSADIHALTAAQQIHNNRNFIVAEAIAFVEETFPELDYNSAKCARDTGLIVDSISQDLMFDSSSQSTFAGIQYWNHDSYVGTIASELTTTTNAINYVKSLAQKIVRNITTGTRYQVGIAQNVSLPAATVSEANTIATDFTVITNILANGVAGVTDIIVPNSLTASTNVNVTRAYALLQANKNYLRAEAVAFVEATKSTGFVYDKTKCSRDVGFMVDSISIDLLYGGNKQAVQSGVYYYGFSTTSTALPGEQTQSVATYNYIRSILPNIIQNVPVASPYQTTVAQNTSGTASTLIQSVNAQSRIDTITDIVTSGPTVSGRKMPLGLNRSINPNVVNAAKLIEANRAFIVAETIAYINGRYISYNKVKCRRDVGFIVDALIYDLEKGGNYNAVSAGRSYYAEHGTHHIVQLEENVTDPALFPDGAITTFYQRSYISAAGYLFEYVGAGANYGALPQRGVADPVQSKEVVQLNNGKVFFTSTDQNGDFRIGTGLVISQATGVLSGRTFTKSLFANLTPFILAIEG